MSIATVRQAALELSWSLSGIDDPKYYVQVALENLDALLASDSVGWYAIRPGQDTAIASNRADHTTDDVRSAFESHIHTHPALASWNRLGADIGPRRLTDLISLRQWRDTPAYCEVYRPMGVLTNVCFLTRAVGSGMLTGWSFCRQSSDFTDDECELTAWMQPVLAAFDLVFDAAGTARTPASGRGLDAAQRVGLTSREVQVLSYLNAGMSATQIGSVLRISHRTVRKHLEHAYRKLGTPDRLLAVDRARGLGIVVASPSSARSAGPLDTHPQT